MKTHLQEEGRTWAACGIKTGKLATDPGKVDCLNCEKTIAQLLETPEEEARRRAAPRARAIARQRALAVLKDRYPDEYLREARRALRDVWPDLYAAELAFVERWRARE